ncbi:MAG TPA: NUDIX domain-containing protein [Victivallales bacterium]|nr:NUDIX domain-containing protein [Victivallales bacterium]
MIHPFSSRIQVAAAVIRHSGSILISSRAEGEFRGYWEFPGGKIHPGESPAECAEREILEELDTRIIALDTIFRASYDYTGKSVEIFFVRAFWVEGSVLNPLDGQQVEWLKPGEIRAKKILPADMEFVRLFF